MRDMAGATVPMLALTNDPQPDGHVRGVGTWFLLNELQAQIAEADGTARRVQAGDHQEPSSQQLRSYKKPYDN